MCLLLLNKCNRQNSEFYSSIFDVFWTCSLLREGECTDWQVTDFFISLSFVISELSRVDERE